MHAQTGSTQAEQILADPCSCDGGACTRDIMQSVAFYGWTCGMKASHESAPIISGCRVTGRQMMTCCVYCVAVADIEVCATRTLAHLS